MGGGADCTISETSPHQGLVWRSLTTPF